MPYVNKPRPYKHEYEMQQKRGELPDRMERQRARREMDAKGIVTVRRDNCPLVVRTINTCLHKVVAALDSSPPFLATLTASC